MNIPWAADAVVTQQDPDNHAVYVMLLGAFGGQGPAIPVKITSHGPRDGVRGSYDELPMPGQTGTVVFTRNDIRNGRWIGSHEPALVDAQPGKPGAIGGKYWAGYSGAWNWAGGDGVTASTLADGSTFLAGEAMPEITRHTLDGDQRRQRTVFSQGERNPAPPGPLPFSVVLASGAKLTVSASGAGSVAIPAGQVLSLAAGSTTLAIDASGNATVTAGDAVLTLDASGNVSVTGTTIAVSGTSVTVSGTSVAITAGSVTASSGGAAQAVKLADGSNSVILKAQ